jgi:hypothetical protein
VYHRATRAMVRGKVSPALRRPRRAQGPAFSVQARKAWFPGWQDVGDIFHVLPAMPEALLLEQVGSKIAELGRGNLAVNPA